MGFFRSLSQRPLVKQLWRFGIAGSISFVLDYGIFIALIRLASVHYALAAAISFAVSAGVNWMMNAYWVFDSSRIANRSLELLLFLVIAVIGLGINELMLWIGIEHLSAPAEFVKLLATIVVAIWNFVIRKLVLYR